MVDCENDSEGRVVSRRGSPEGGLLAKLILPILLAIGTAGMASASPIDSSSQVRISFDFGSTPITVPVFFMLSVSGLDPGEGIFEEYIPGGSSSCIGEPNCNAGFWYPQSGFDHSAAPLLGIFVSTPSVEFLMRSAVGNFELLDAFALADVNGQLGDPCCAPGASRFQGAITITRSEIPAVPEPSGLILFVAGIVTVCAIRR